MKVAIVTPVFNDWESADQLLARLDGLTLPGVSRLRVVVVNDGSTISPSVAFASRTLSKIDRLVLLDLAVNLGHQRAIALGIAVVAQDDEDDLLVIMDSDGEDDPNDVPRLISAYRDHPGHVVVAKRSERSEGVRFRLGYHLYRMMFRLLVGRRIRFGNFCAINRDTAVRLARSSHAWNHLAASLLRSGLPIFAVETRRGRRYAGQPTTNFVSLITHGLSALAVFSDYVIARLFLFAALMGAFAFAGGLIVLTIRLFTDRAVPGWATAAGGVFTIILVQALLLFLIAAVQSLASRSQVGAIPANLAETFVKSRTEFSR
jgi:glycosyltransferase involved in cell wall biosynthesis